MDYWSDRVMRFSAIQYTPAIHYSNFDTVLHFANGDAYVKKPLCFSGTPQSTDALCSPLRWGQV
jgi:hypothetical protein